MTDEGALVARAPRSSHGQLPAATQGRHTGPPGLTVSRSRAGRPVSGPYGMPETVFSFVGVGPRPAHRFGKYVGAHSVRPRAGLGPAPTDIPERSRFFVGAAHRAARSNRVPFSGGPASVRPLRHTRNGFLFCRGGSQTRPKAAPAAPLLAHRQNED